MFVITKTEDSTGIFGSQPKNMYIVHVGYMYIEDGDTDCDVSR